MRSLGLGVAVRQVGDCLVGRTPARIVLALVAGWLRSRQLDPNPRPFARMAVDLDPSTDGQGPLPQVAEALATRTNIGRVEPSAVVINLQHHRAPSSNSETRQVVA